MEFAFDARTEEYRENLWKRILRGHANHMELYLAETVFGPRKQQVEVSGDVDLVARLAGWPQAPAARGDDRVDNVLRQPASRATRIGCPCSCLSSGC
jgi:hypothetical protein